MDRHQQILQIIQKVAKKDVQPAPDESLFDSGILDSFALPDMVSALEEDFQIKVPDADLSPQKFDSIERIESYLDAHS